MHAHPHTHPLPLSKEPQPYIPPALSAPIATHLLPAPTEARSGYHTGKGDIEHPHLRLFYPLLPSLEKPLCFLSPFQPHTVADIEDRYPCPAPPTHAWRAASHQAAACLPEFPHALARAVARGLVRGSAHTWRTQGKGAKYGCDG